MNLEETWMPLALFADLTWEVMENSKYHYIEQIKKDGDRSQLSREIVPIVPDARPSGFSGIDPHKRGSGKNFRGFYRTGVCLNTAEISLIAMTIISH